MDTTSKRTEKEQQWQLMANHFAHVTDKLGKGIDTGIMDTVIVLNLLSIHTSQSCEGHLEWGTGSPWVDIRTPGLQEEERRFQEAMKEAQQQREQGQLSKEEIKRLFEEAHRQRKAFKQKYLEERKKAISYLAAFYEGRVVPYDRRLIICGSGLGTGRIESQGADFQEVTPLEIRLQKLQEYQEEMQAFTAFLKDTWFSIDEGDAGFADELT